MWVIEQLLANGRGHWGPLEHPAITFSCSGFVHNVIVQARTHRVGISFDVQSQRYTCKRVLKVASGETESPRKYSMSVLQASTPTVKGKKYDWSQDDYETQLGFVWQLPERYAHQFNIGGVSEDARVTIYPRISARTL